MSETMSETIDTQRKARRLVNNEVRQCFSYAHNEMMCMRSYEKLVWEALEAIDLDQDDEIYEIWIVSHWLARQLEEHSQITWEWNDVCFWGRMTTGQSIAMDHVIQQIANR